MSEEEASVAPGEEGAADGDDAYRGVLGAFPYAVRSSDSWAFRVYGVVAALVALATVAVFGLALVGIVASTANQTASVTLVRAFVVVVLLAVLVPVMAPVLLVARRHRLGRLVDPRYDGALAVGGFAFLASLYVGLLASVPRDMQDPVRGALAPLVEALYGLPQVAGLVPPALAALAIWLLHRRLGRVDAPDADGSGIEGD